MPIRTMEKIAWEGDRYMCCCMCFRLSATACYGLLIIISVPNDGLTRHGYTVGQMQQCVRR